MIKGTKTGDGDAVNIEECLTDGDFVPLKLRARTANGDEEDVAEEQDDDAHESPTFQDQKAMSLFYCPVKGCIKTFLRSSTLQHHMINDEHVIQSKKETIYERAKQGYAKRLEEGSHANPALQTKFEVFQGENNLKQGWALKSCKSRSPFNDRQKEFLNEIFEEGERTGIKANPDTVAKTMRRARNENNERVFQVSEFLTSQQVASYFSRKKNSPSPKLDSPPQAVCSTCVKYQLNLKTKEHLLQMKIKDLRSIVRELKLGVKGRKKDDVIQVLLRHASDCQL